MAAPIRFLSGRQQQQKIGIEGSTDNEKVLEVVGRVGIGTTVFEPSTQLEVRGDTNISEGGNLNVSGVSTFTGTIDANGSLDVDGHTELDDVNVSGASTFASAIDANGGLDVSGGAGLVASSAKISDLTNNRIVLAGTDGELEDTSKLTFDGSTLAIVGDATFTGNVSIAGTLTKEDVTDIDSIGLVTARTGVRIDTGGLVVSSGVSTFLDDIVGNNTTNISGINSVTAGSFHGSGIGLTGITAEQVGALSELLDDTTPQLGGDLDLNGKNITGIGSIIITGIVSATELHGDGSNITGLTPEQVGALSELVDDTTPQLGGDLDLNGNNITGIGSFDITGIITATEFHGDGSNLENLPPSGVTPTENSVDQSQSIPFFVGSSSTTIANISSQNFVFNPSTVRLGIGTSLPESTLDVNGNVNISGFSTIPNVVGPTTFTSGDVNVGAAITFDPVSGIVSATAFYGSGENLSDLILGKIDGLQVQDEGVNIGAASSFSTLNFTGPGVTATGIGSTAVINIPGITTDVSINTTGIITASEFHGDGSNLSNTNGFSTSLSSDPSSPLYRIYKEKRTLNITAGIHTVLSDSDHGDLAFTKSDTIVISSGGTFEVSSGTTFRTNIINLFPSDEDLDVNAQNLNVLGISTFAGNINANGIITATSYRGDGSQLTGITASGSGIIVRDGGSLVGTAGTIDFGDNLSVSPISAGVVTVTASGSGSGSIAGIDTSGTSTFNNLSVSGFSTFTELVDVNGSLDVDGHTELDDVNVSGASTFTGAIDANGSLDVDGHTELDDVNVSGASTFTGAIDANGSLDVDGHTELDNVNVSGFATVGTFLSVGGGINCGADFNVTGVTVLTGIVTTFNNVFVGGNVNATGIITANSFSGITTSMISDYGNGLAGGYSNSNVDTHLNTSTASDDEVLSWTGTDYAWVAQSGGSSSRGSLSQSTGSIGAGTTTNITITGHKSYMLQKISTSHAAWIRIYTDTASRTADESREHTTDPLPGSGVIAEVRTTTSGISTFIMSPGVMGWNDDSTPGNNIYARVTNNESGSSDITVTLTAVQLES